MEEKIDNLSNRLDDKFDGLTTLFENYIKEQKEITTSYENKFASKWVERCALWGGGVIGTFLLLYVLKQLFV